MELPDHVTAQLHGLQQVVGHSQESVRLSNGTEGIRVRVTHDPEGVPDRVGGFPTEVQVVGPNRRKTRPATQVNPKEKTRPLLGGISVGDDESGTLGYFIYIDGKPCLMTSSHVLPDLSDVFQPAPFHGGGPTDRVARVVATVDDCDYGVDVAAAELLTSDGIQFDPWINGIGKVVGMKPAFVGQKVQKSGQVSGATRGTVTEAKARELFEGRWYANQIVVEGDNGVPFSQGGDSGSLIVDKDLNAVGLLMAGDDVRDSVNDIYRVMKFLNATLAM